MHGAPRGGCIGARPSPPHEAPVVEGYWSTCRGSTPQKCGKRGGTPLVATITGTR